MKIRIIQVRGADDAMLGHELRCLSRKCRKEHPALEICVSNAVVEHAVTDWLDGIGAVIIGGSGAYSVYSESIQDQVHSLMGLIETCATRGVPLFGICFGHQLIAQTFGGDIRPTPSASEMGTVMVNLTDAGRHDSVFGELPDKFEVQSGHSDSVMTAPKHARPLCSNEAGIYQAFRLGDLPIYGTQFHCDLTGEEARERYLAYRAEIAAKNGFDRGDANIFRPGEDATESVLSRFLNDAEEEMSKRFLHKI